MEDEGGIPAFERSSPGLLTFVELNMTSNIVVAAGVKPFGVCACAMPTAAAMTRGEVNRMMSKNSNNTYLTIKEITSKTIFLTEGTEVNRIVRVDGASSQRMASEQMRLKQHAYKGRRAHTRRRCSTASDAAVKCRIA